VVVNDVQDDSQLKAVSRIDQRSKICGTAVAARRREKIDAVVSPVATAWKVADGHELHRRDSELRKVRKTPSGGSKGAFRCKRPDMEFIEHKVRTCHALPIVIGPLERRWIDDLRRTVYAIRLTS
jgi:hypothetical protein